MYANNSGLFLFPFFCLLLTTTSRSVVMKRLIVFVVCLLLSFENAYSFRLLVLPRHVDPPKHLNLQSREYVTYNLSPRQARQIIETR